MKLYELEIDVRTPLQISDIVVGNVLKHAYLYYLPSSIIKGAILTKLYNEYDIKDVIEESNKPSISIKPAYPILYDREAKPAHPLLHKCKLCKDNNIFLNEVFKDANSLYKFNYEDFKVPFKCPKNHYFSIGKVDGLIVFDGKSYRNVGFKTTQFESIGINRGLGSTEVGMLYSYTTISPGILFKTMLVDDGTFSKWIDKLPKRDIYFMGRSRSRGMGLVEISINEISNDYLNGRINDIKESIEKTKGLIILRALSPVVNDFKVFSIDLTQYGLNPHYVYKNYNYIPNGKFTLKGYSMITNLPKIYVNCLAPGTLYFYKVSNGNIINVVRRIAELEVKGFAPPYNIGFNYLEVYTDVRYIL